MLALKFTVTSEERLPFPNCLFLEKIKVVWHFRLVREVVFVPVTRQHRIHQAEGYAL